MERTNTYTITTLFMSHTCAGFFLGLLQSWIEISSSRFALALLSARAAVVE